MPTTAGFILNSFRIILLLWFLIVSVFVLLPSYELLQAGRRHEAAPKPADVSSVASNLDDIKKDRPDVADMPDAPEPEPGTLIDAAEGAQVAAQRVALFQQQVKLFEFESNAYEKRQTRIAKPSQAATYELVVKGTLAQLVRDFLSALLAYAFISGGSQLLDNRQRIAASKEPEPLRLF